MIKLSYSLKLKEKKLILMMRIQIMYSPDGSHVGLRR